MNALVALPVAAIVIWLLASKFQDVGRGNQKSTKHDPSKEEGRL